ncbi:hypothetical protein ACHAW5_005005 [Stephanodiscus triporus]|uniref:Sulfotransferase domain-containing protein n=1 Tax=Stephanodiscus triporus TaxID=2934178 RepID=A0ABD3P0W5_9STRA
MSEFASLLNSFKKTAARKRPHAENVVVRPPSPPPAHPSFPSVHRDVGRGDDGGVGGSSDSFELSFLVIGAQKAGTSWLHSQLRRCDRLALPRDRKEVHFWDWHHRRGFDWYVRQFDFPPRRRGAGAGGDERRPLRYGEITPCYVVLPPPTIAEIKRCFPGIKLIFVARNLVDRAWSAMVMELRDRNMGMNPGEFADGVVEGGGDDERRGPKRSRQRVDAVSIAQRLRMQRQSSPSSWSDEYFLERLRSETHASRSDYAAHLRHWYAHFPPESILLLDYREIEADPRGLLLRVAMHVGLAEDEARAYVTSLREEDVRRRVNAADANDDETSRRALSRRPDLERKMREHLLPYTRDFNEMLAERGLSWKLSEV